MHVTGSGFYFGQGLFRLKTPSPKKAAEPFAVDCHNHASQSRTNRPETDVLRNPNGKWDFLIISNVESTATGLHRGIAAIRSLVLTDD